MFRPFRAAAAAILLAVPALAHDGVHIVDPYARVSGATAKSGAVFLVIENHGTAEDRLVAAASDIADRVELHTHRSSADGVMQMVHVPEGFAIPAGATHALDRGGDHVMLLGLKRPLAQGDTFPLTLTFARGEVITIDVPVDNTRMPAHGGAGHGHGSHGDGAMHGGGHGTHGGGHAMHGQSAAVDQSGLSDPDAIVAVMKAQFDTPENPLTVEPLVVLDRHALAAWSQGDRAGRALVEKRAEGWVIVLCAGPELREADFLAQHGVGAASQLSSLYNAAEDALGGDRVARFSSFEGVVIVTP